MEDIELGEYNRDREADREADRDREADQETSFNDGYDDWMDESMLHIDVTEGRHRRNIESEKRRGCDEKGLHGR